MCVHVYVRVHVCTHVHVWMSIRHVSQVLLVLVLLLQKDVQGARWAGVHVVDSREAAAALGGVECVYVSACVRACSCACMYIRLRACVQSIRKVQRGPLHQLY